jgi:hypothetical protein
LSLKAKSKSSLNIAAGRRKFRNKIAIRSDERMKKSNKGQR